MVKFSKLSSEPLNTKKKYETAAEKFFNTHTKKLCNRCGKVKDICQEVNKYNNTYPKLTKELSKRKSTSNVRALSLKNSRKLQDSDKRRLKRLKRRRESTKRLYFNARICVSNKGIQYNEVKPTLDAKVGTASLETVKCPEDPKRTESGVLHINSNHSTINFDQEPMV